MSGYADEKGGMTFVVTNIDKVLPSVPTSIDITTDTNAITVTAGGSDDNLSGVMGYKYSIDNELWSDVVAVGESYRFNNVDTSTDYIVYVKAVDSAGNYSSVVNNNSITAGIVGNVEISINNSNWTNQNLTATVTYSQSIPDGYEIQYKVGTSPWRTGNTATISENCEVSGRLYKRLGNNAYDAAAYNTVEINKIDKGAPSAPVNISVSKNSNSIDVSASGSRDSISGVSGYIYSIDGTNWTGVVANGQTCTFSDLSIGNTYIVYSKGVDGAGNISTLAKTVEVRI